MEARSDQPPLICIVGETASGKTDLALELAGRFNGEIIAADSRTIYRGMDIGTAKPTIEERARTPHHLIDIVEPDWPITAAQYATLANQAISDAASRGKNPFLVGGSGLYIDAVVYGFDFMPPPDPALRARLQAMTIPELQAELASRDIPLPTNSNNPRHLMRKIETHGTKPRQHNLRSNTLLLALQIDRSELLARVIKRTESMLSAGLVQEASSLFDQYGKDCNALLTIGYRECLPYLQGKMGYEQLRQEIIRNTMRYAKRQRTWFRRNGNIQYICKTDEAVDLVTTFLNKESIANERSLLQ